MLENPLGRMWTDNGVLFIKFLWEECQHELEQFTQKEIDDISAVVLRIGKKTRPEHFEGIKIGK